MSTAHTVLLISPFESVPELLDTAVASGDVSVVLTPTFETGLQVLRERTFDLVILDWPVAQAAGGQVRALREARGDAKIIVVSRDPEPEDVLTAIREHAFACFRAPLELGRVKDAIGRALGALDWEDGIEVVSALPNWISLRLRCRRFTADRVLDFLAEMRVDLPVAERESIGTAVREILLNAIEHGGGLDPRKRVQVSRIRTPRLVVYHLHDPGPGFSFDTLAHAAVSNPPDDPMAHARAREEMRLRPGGFGIMLTQSMIDELIYSERGNEVVLIKYLDSGR